MEHQFSAQSDYVSCMKLHGCPIIAPYMDEAKRLEMRHYRALAMAVDNRLELAAQRRQEVKRISEDSGVSDFIPSSYSEMSQVERPIDEATSTLTSEDDDGGTILQFESFPPLETASATIEHALNFGSGDDVLPGDSFDDDANIDDEAAHTTASTDLGQYCDFTIEDSPESVDTNRNKDPSLTPTVPYSETVPSLTSPAVALIPSPGLLTGPEYVSLKLLFDSPEASTTETLRSEQLSTDVADIPPLVRQNSYTLLDGPSSLIMAHAEAFRTPNTQRAGDSPSRSSKRGWDSAPRDIWSSADSIQQLFAAPRFTAKKLPSKSVPSSPVKSWSAPCYGSVDNLSKRPARRSLFTSTPDRPSRPTPRHAAKHHSQDPDVVTPRRPLKRPHRSALKLSLSCRKPRGNEVDASSDVKELETVEVASNVKNASPSNTKQAGEPAKDNEMNHISNEVKSLDQSLLARQLKMEFEKQMALLVEHQRQEQEKMRKFFEDKLMADLAQYEENAAEDLDLQPSDASSRLSDESRQALYMDSSSHKENVSDSYASSDLSSFKTQRRPEETFRPLHQNGQTPLPAGRRTQPTASQREKRAASLIVACARGYLVRRLLRTHKVQSIVQTIRDVTATAVDLHREANVDVEVQDVELSRRLIYQLNALWLDFYDVFFNTTPKQQMSLIRLDRERLRFSPQPTPRTAYLSRATQRTIQRRINGGDPSPAVSRRNSESRSIRSQCSNHSSKQHPSPVDSSNKSLTSPVESSNKSRTSPNDSSIMSDKSTSRKPWR